MKKIGKYIIRGLLGRGGMSKVYKVEIPVIRKIAAIKLLEPPPLLVELMGQKKMRELFISEAIVMAKLRHPNILKILDFDETDGKPFYVMDYYCNNLGNMIGENYIVEMPSRTISIDKAIHYTRQTLSGLAALHHAGIIHRDIKPYNILVTDQDTVKISDFGLSKLRGEAFSGPSNLNVGSPYYAPPEQEENPDQVDFTADVYPVGIMLYRMLTGNLPTEAFDPPSRLNSDLDASWDRFIGKAMAKISRNRFTSANEMLGELDNLQTSWEEKKERICKIQEASPSKPKISAHAEVTLRREPAKAGSKEACDVFLTDELWRPRTYIPNELNDNQDGTVTDKSTGLVWQQSGSEYPLTWDQAHAYVYRLNEKQCAGHTGWRLPTVNELMSLLIDTPHGEDFCIEPIFEKKQKWLWSADRRSFTSAWYVSIDLGFVSWQDFTCFYYARGVCSI